MGTGRIIVESGGDKRLFETLIPLLVPSTDMKRRPEFEDEVKKTGRPAAIQRYVNQAGDVLARKHLLAVDLDDDSPDTLLQAVKDVARKSGFDEDVATKGLIKGLGLPGDEFLKGYGVTSFAIEDYLFKLVMDPEVFEILKKAERIKVSFDVVSRKVTAIREKLVDNGIEVSRSKHLLKIFQVASGWLVGPGELASRIIEKAPGKKLEEVFEGVSPVLREWLK